MKSGGFLGLSEVLMTRLLSQKLNDLRIRGPTTIGQPFSFFHTEPCVGTVPRDPMMVPGALFGVFGLHFGGKTNSLPMIFYRLLNALT